MTNFFKAAFTAAIVVLIMSCSTDYDGTSPDSENPKIGFGSDDTLLTRYPVVVDWSAEIGGETELDYYYCVTTDTSVTSSSARTFIASDKWVKTKEKQALISFPAAPFNNDSIIFKDSTGSVFSKMFLYARNSAGTLSPVISKLFLRSNNRPSFVRLTSDYFSLSSSMSYSYGDIYEPDKKVIMPAGDQRRSYIDLSWIATDPDSLYSLEYKCDIYEKDSGKNDPVWTTGWSSKDNVMIGDGVFSQRPYGWYRFVVKVRDDALQEAERSFVLFFEVFTPSFDKGILLIDDTDPELTSLSTSVYMGNPDGTDVRNFYEEILENAGYKPEGQATDSLHLYRISRFIAETDTVAYDYLFVDDDGDPSTPEIADSIMINIGLYRPDIEELCGYRLVIIMSDDRSNLDGVNFNANHPYTAYSTILSRYLDTGGKVFIAGPSVLMGKYYSSPYQLPVSEYKAPYRYLFDGSVESGQFLGANSENFFNRYFGISAMTFPEQKTYYTEITGTNTMQYSADHYLADNYDFIGVEKYTMVTDPSFKNAGMDTVRVNDAWFSVAGTGGRIRSHALKDNGTVFTGIPSFRTSAGENIYKYKSIYDLPRITGNDSLSIDENGQTHYLWNMNKVTGEVHSPVLQRSGTVAARYAHESGIYKTAFFGFPLYFMDNSSNQMTDMFKAMIDWFDLSTDPLGKRR
jgi:hypothetical protein